MKGVFLPRSTFAQCAAAASSIGVQQRIDGIKANAEQLLRRMPTGWDTWSVDRTREFKRRVAEMRKAKSLLQAQSAAHQLAGEYRCSVFDLDPWGRS